jgi:dienelactone hydrolase
MKRPGPAQRPSVSRRTVLTSGLAGAAMLGVGVSADGYGYDPPPPAPLANQKNVFVERVHSQARNRDVDIVLITPKGVPSAGLPVCLMLHGRYGDARKSAGGLPIWLSHAVSRGMPPFAFLAVDGGGNSYWHRGNGDDPMWMLLDEVPNWLAERGLGEEGQPFAVSGISMGGFGALLYARRRRERGNPVRAAAVVSPALITDWREMAKRKAFLSESAWDSIDPLRHVRALGPLPLGVWCGTQDRFITGTRKFITLARPEVASTSPGGHNSRYYRKALPEAIGFLGKHVHSPGTH